MPPSTRSLNLSRLYLGAVQNYLGKISCRRFIAYVQNAALLVPKNVVERMVDEHTQECPDDDLRVHLSKNAFLLAFLDVIAQKICRSRPRIRQRTCPPFHAPPVRSRRSCEGTPHRSAAYPTHERRSGKKTPKIVLRLHSFSSSFLVALPGNWCRASLHFFFVEQGHRKATSFDEKCLEYHRFGYARRLRDILRRRSAESALREQVEGGLHDQLTSLVP